MENILINEKILKSVFIPIKQKVITTLAVSTLLFGVTAVASTVQADETCMSPYMAKIVGQEDFVYVWTLGE